MIFNVFSSLAVIFSSSDSGLIFNTSVINIGGCFAVLVSVDVSASIVLSSTGSA